MKNNNQTTWHHVREYINSVPDAIITRKKILIHLHTIGGLKYSDNYVDTLRNQLEKVGYLGKCLSVGNAPIAGKFYRKKLIPEDLSIGMLRKQYDTSISNF